MIVHNLQQHTEAISFITSKVEMQKIFINLCQKLLFLHQLIHNMITDCSFNYKLNRYMKIPSSNLGRTCRVQKLFLTFRRIFVHNMFSPCTAKRRTSDKDLPIQILFFFKVWSGNWNCFIDLDRIWIKPEWNLNKKTWTIP